MNFWQWLRSRLATFRQRRDRDKDLDRELESHLDLEAQAQMESGLSPREARYAARRAFGNTTLVREDLRAIWTRLWLERLASHIKYAARSLRKNPGFTAIAVLTLALGIGANTAIFSAIDALMLRPLPFSSPDQLVRVYSTVKLPSAKRKATRSKKHRNQAGLERLQAAKTSLKLLLSCVKAFSSPSSNQLLGLRTPPRGI